jgi:hypothetical protein
MALGQVLAIGVLVAYSIGLIWMLFRMIFECRLINKELRRAKDELPTPTL